MFLSDSAGSEDGMDALRMNSITYRIATGRDAGRKVVTLQTLPGDTGSLEGDARRVGGFSLHAGVAAEAHESHKLEKLCRHITRSAISERRLSISQQARVCYQLKTPWCNGTTHVKRDAVDLMAHIPVRHPASDLRSSKSAVLPICHRQVGGAGPAATRASHPVSRHLCPERCPARGVDAIGARQAACDLC